MVLLCVLFVPFFYRSRVYTAYQYLEQRFDAKTRSLTCILFLLSRGMAAGIVRDAPAVVLSVIFAGALIALRRSSPSGGLNAGETSGTRLDLHLPSH